MALALRLYGLETRDLWYDEAFSFFLSEQSLVDIVSGTAADTEPPFYYFLLHFWLNLGQTPLLLRLLSVLLSMGTVLVVFDLTRRLAGVNAALWAALLTAISPFQIYHAQEMRMYGLLALTQISYFWFFVRLQMLEKPKKPLWLWAGLVAAGTAAIYSQSLAIFGLVLADVYLLIKRNWRSLRNLLIAQTAILILSIPWLIHVPGQIQKIQTAFYTPVPGFIEVLQAVLQTHAFMPIVGWQLTIAAVLSLQCVVMVSLEAYKARKIDGIGFAVLLWLGLPTLLFAASYLMRPVFVPRGFITSMLGYYILAGWIIALRWKKGIGPLIASAFIVLAAISLPSYYSFSEFPRSEFRIATQYLQENAADDDLILHDNKLSYFPAHYYDPDLEQVFLPDEPGSHNDTYAPASQRAIGLYPAESLESAVSEEDTVWFVVFSRAIAEYKEAGELTHPVLADLSQRYRLDQHKNFGDLEIYTYRR